MSQRLSFTKGVQLSHDNEATSHANNKSNITNSITITTPSTAVTYDPTPPLESDLPSPYADVPIVHRDVAVDASTDTDVEFLKKVIAIYMSTTRLYSDQTVVCSKEELIDLISTLTSCTTEIDTADIDIDCGCSSSIEIPYDSVSTIWVTDSTGTKSVFKYQ